MTRALAWVVGEGGLLGSQVRGHLSAEQPDWLAWRRSAPLCWAQPALLERQLDRELDGFFATAAGFEAWVILWCAGAGVSQTSDALLTAETLVFERFLEKLDARLADRRRRIPGVVALASSAGGLYGEPGAHPVTEETPCRPGSEYGRQKLRQESALRARFAARPELGWLIGRFSTLYGIGQNLSKPQGFISQLVRALLFRRPVRVYVPLDTQRDFLYAADAARHFLRCANRLLSPETPGRAVKIFAAGRSVALSEVVALLRRISRQTVQILSLPGLPRGLHAAKPVFRSVALSDVEVPTITTLTVGVFAVYRHQLALLQCGRLPPP